MTPNFKQIPFQCDGKKKLIRQIPCIMPGTWKHSCSEGTDPAHLKSGMYAGANRKDDRRMLPLCRVHHTVQHSMPEREFWGVKFVDAMVLADYIHIIYLEGRIEEDDEEDTLNKMIEACERFGA